LVRTPDWTWRKKVLEKGVIKVLGSGVAVPLDIVVTPWSDSYDAPIYPRKGSGLLVGRWRHGMRWNFLKRVTPFGNLLEVHRNTKYKLGGEK
jgi:hypothetical protein